MQQLANSRVAWGTSLRPRSAGPSEAISACHQARPGGTETRFSARARRNFCNTNRVPARAGASKVKSARRFRLGRDKRRTVDLSQKLPIRRREANPPQPVTGPPPLGRAHFLSPDPPHLLTPRTIEVMPV